MQERELFLVSGLLMITVALFLFLSSTHTIDLSYNVIRLEKAYSLPNMYDMTLGGQFVDYEQAYINATNSLFFGFFIMMFGCILFGIGLRQTDSYKKDKKKRF